MLPDGYCATDLTTKALEELSKHDEYGARMVLENWKGRI